MIIAIDGTSGSGKTTLVELLGKKLQMNVIYSGKIYRCITLCIIKQLKKKDKNIKILSIKSFKEIPESIVEDILKNHQISFSEDGKTIFLDQKDITSLLEGLEMDHLTSVSSQNPHIRNFVNHILKEKAKLYKNLIVEGRDITSIVFPNADFKFFITADPYIRASRRLKQHQNNKEDIKLLEAEMIKRDKRDSQRKDAPLTLVKDAHLIQNNTTLNETLKEMMDIIFD